MANRILRFMTAKHNPIDRIPNMARGSQSQSWWANAAQPDQREDFMQLARARHEGRIHEQNVKEVKALYTQGRGYR